MDDAKLALALARGRIVFGVVAVAAPGLTARLLGGRKASGIEPLLTRMLGARDLTLGLGAVIALDRGAPVRGWIEGAAVSDAIDATACLLARKHMSRGGFKGTLVLASGSAALGAYLARRLDPPPPAQPHQPEAVITGHPEPSDS
jgi:hypothetical protein